MFPQNTVSLNAITIAFHQTTTWLSGARRRWSVILDGTAARPAKKEQNSESINLLFLPFTLGTIEKEGRNFLRLLQRGLVSLE